jgi:predicted nucleic acid-binding protein
MAANRPVTPAGVIDTNIVILRRLVDVAQLPETMAVTAVTMAELSAGVHLVDSADDAERARRLDVLQRAERDFEPLPFDADAARAYGRVCAAVKTVGRNPRGRVADLMIAATALANGLPLFTTNPRDFAGLDGLVEVVAVSRPTT